MDAVNNGQEVCLPMTDIATVSNAEATASAVEAARRGEGVAVLVPCYNEAPTIAKVVSDFRAALPEATIYVYDNNSTDGTADIAAAAGAVVRRESRQGKGNVVRSMFRDIDAEYYLMVDGDDTYPAEAAGDLIAPLAADEADMTVGDRISNGAYGKENERPFHNFGNNLVRRLIKVIYGYAFEDVMTGYRAFTRAFVKTMARHERRLPDRDRRSPSGRSDRRWRVADVPIDYRDRPEGSESKLSTFSDGMLVLGGHREPVPRLPPHGLLRLARPGARRGGLCFGLPVVAEYFDTGYVAKLPSAVLAVALMIVAALSWTAGLILDTVAKSHRRQWEVSVYEVY